MGGNYRSMRMEEVAIEEAVSAGVKSMENLVHLLSSSSSSSSSSQNCREMAENTVGKFNTLISVLNRTGHARFRRAPINNNLVSLSDSSNSSESQFQTSIKPSIEKPIAIRVVPQPQKPITLDFTNPNPNPNSKSASMTMSISSSANSSSFLSSITGEGSVSNGKQFVARPCSSGKPPLSTSCHHRHTEDLTVGKMSRCHCSSKRKKLRVKKTIRVPAISSKTADIPSDEYSWRKYGQKPIKGSPYPRGYYKCSSVRGCPARKHVERATDDPAMLIVTYEGEHRHSPAPASQEIISHHHHHHHHLHNNHLFPATTPTPPWLLSQPIFN